MLEVRPFSLRDKRFRALAQRRRESDPAVLAEAAETLRAIREGGGDALLEHVRRLDSPHITEETLRVSPEEITLARNETSEQFLTALSLARVNMRKFHEYQRRRGYVHDDGDGVTLSRLTRPVNRIGVCCRDSFAALLACVVPAQVAGVGEIAVAAAPRRDGRIDPRILATAKVLGIEEVYRMDGAHAVAALAFGSGPLEQVDKIVGPGNALAAAAKRLLFGVVGVDAPAGRSELAVVADDGANARFIAADLLAQAEAEEEPGALVLFATDRLLAEAVRIEIKRMAGDEGEMRLRLERCGGLFVCSNVEEAMAGVNLLAPAHLELMTRDNQACLADLENAGGVFLGSWSAEAAGDLFAGINPFLPIGGAARFSSGLGVDDFVREISLVEYSPGRLLKAGRHMLILAGEEGTCAHAAAIRERLDLLRPGSE